MPQKVSAGTELLLFFIEGSTEIDFFYILHRPANSGRALFNSSLAAN